MHTSPVCIEEIMTTAEPTSAPPSPTHARFYGIDSRKVTLKEYGFEAKNPLQYVLILLVGTYLKLARKWFTGSTEDVPVDSLDPFLTTGEAFPENVWAAMHPLVAELETLGFQVAAYHLIDDPAHLTTYYAVTMQGRGNTVARVHYRIWRQTHPHKVYTHISLLSRLGNSRFLWSTSSRPDMIAPPQCTVIRRIKANAAMLLSAHEQAVAAQREAVLPIRGIDDVLNVINDHHAVVTQFHLDRGVFTEQLHATESARVDKALAAPPGAPVVSSRHQLILDEIDKIQNAKTNIRRTLLLLVVSAILFYVAGIKGIVGKDFLFLIPILLFHELGHYVAMRIFGYRNLRMFFIPFFGAAVSGRNYNIAGWKKAIVSLMGPLPGIVLAIPLGIVGISNNQPTLLHIAFLLLALNASNLIPVLPLDGGHIFQHVLFCRHYGLNIAFRIVAIVCLAPCALLPGGMVMLYLAIFMALGIPLSYRLGKITYDLRREGVGAKSADDQTIPPETAERIIDKLSTASQRPVPNRMMARQVLTVFESLNARPPGVFASIALLFTQGGAVFISMVCAFLFIWSQQGLFKNFGAAMRAATQQPRHRVAAGPYADWHGARYTFAGAAKEKTVVAMFPTEREATQKKAALTETLPATAALRQFSDTLFVTFPASATADANTIFDTILPDKDNVFMQSTDQNTSVRMMAIPQNATDAADIQQELSEYLRTTNVAPHEIPPWQAAQWSTPEQYAAYRLARATLLKAREKSVAVYNDPDYEALSRKVFEAIRRGDKEATEKFQGQQKEMRTRLVKANLETMKSRPDGEVDHELLAILLSRPDHEYRLYSNLPPAAITRLGIIPEKGHASVEAAQCANGGWVRVTGPYLTVNATFDAGEHGIRALSRWLEEKKCVHLLYDIHAMPVHPDFDD